MQASRNTIAQRMRAFISLNDDGLHKHTVDEIRMRVDWAYALVAAVVSGCIYAYSMAPSVTLQDAGELITAAFTFGVPHPPGYPFWTLLGWFWCHVLFPFGNIAWRLGMMSVLFGALTVGTMTVLMIRSLRLLLQALPWCQRSDGYLCRMMPIVLGLGTAFLFGFSRGVWLWSGVAEMRILNVFSFVFLSYCLFSWLHERPRHRFLYLAILVFSTGIANHQTIALLCIPMAIMIMVTEWQHYRSDRQHSDMSDPVICLAASGQTVWELVTAGLLSMGVGVVIWAWLRYPPTKSLWQYQTLWLGLVVFMAGWAGLDMGRKTRCWSPRRAICFALSFLLGMSFYLYMPLAATTNPPMNWGYTATKMGFVHAFSRGQYEEIEVAHIISRQFGLQVRMMIQWLVAQYSLWLSLFALVVPLLLVAGWRRMASQASAWMTYVILAFLVSGIGLLYIVNPAINRQHQFVAMKYFAPSHGFFAMLIAYGIAVVISVIACFESRVLRRILRIGCVFALALPLISFSHNWSDCNLHDHDYGYLFGKLVFSPGHGYEDMEPNAILFGGSDPGRFVPTYMIFCESRLDPGNRFRDATFDRSDVYMLTQNALVDDTYLKTIGDQYSDRRPRVDQPDSYADYPFWKRVVFKYGSQWLRPYRHYPNEPIALPDSQHLETLFKDYYARIRRGDIDLQDGFYVENGNFVMRSQQGVIAMNGELSQWIFEHNRTNHGFYVEESMPLEWMHAYMRPFGVIMKLEPEPLPTPQEDPAYWDGIISVDQAYWAQLTKALLARESFRRSNDARQTFSRLRLAHANLYSRRHLNQAAEHAFNEALLLSPDNPEALFHLSYYYLYNHRFAEASELMEESLAIDPYDPGATFMLERIQARKAIFENIRNVERLRRMHPSEDQ
jgi:hypothetical protein